VLQENCSCTILPSRTSRARISCIGKRPVDLQVAAGLEATLSQSPATI